MRYFSPDINNPAGGDSSRPSSVTVPTGMENDPNADEEIIDQQSDSRSPEDEYPKPVNAPKIAPDNLTDSIAYALDGSGPGPTNDQPNVSGHDVITTGTTGAGLQANEEENR
jgi:hypothetical protein